MADQDRTNMPAVATGAPSVPEIAPAPTEESAPPLRSKRTRPTRFPCIICGKERLARDVTQLDVMRPSLLDAIRSDYPDLPAEGHICSNDLDRYRSRYVARLLGEERGELTKLEEEVVQSLADHETLAENIEAEFAGRMWSIFSCRCLISSSAFRLTR